MTQPRSSALSGSARAWSADDGCDEPIDHGPIPYQRETFFTAGQPAARREGVEIPDLVPLREGRAERQPLRGDLWPVGRAIGVARAGLQIGVLRFDPVQRGPARQVALDGPAQDLASVLAPLDLV